MLRHKLLKVIHYSSLLLCLPNIRLLVIVGNLFKCLQSTLILSLLISFFCFDLSLHQCLSVWPTSFPRVFSDSILLSKSLFSIQLLILLKYVTYAILLLTIQTQAHAYWCSMYNYRSIQELPGSITYLFCFFFLEAPLPVLHSVSHSNLCDISWPLFVTSYACAFVAAFSITWGPPSMHTAGLQLLYSPSFSQRTMLEWELLWMFSGVACLTLALPWLITCLHFFPFYVSINQATYEVCNRNHMFCCFRQVSALAALAEQLSFFRLIERLFCYINIIVFNPLSVQTTILLQWTSRVITPGKNYDF